MGKMTELFSILIGLTAIILTVYYQIPEFHDFTASVDTTSLDIGQGKTANITVEVNHGWLDHEDVSLDVEPKIPGISFLFKPDIIKQGDKKVSQGIVSVDKNTKPGEYSISIIGYGDENRHNCKLRLNVIESKLTSTPTLTPTENTKTPTRDKFNPISNTGDEIATYTPINIFDYTKYTFNVSKSTFYTHLPEGYSYVTATIHVENTGHKPIRSSPSCWQFNCSGDCYYPDSFSTFSHFVLSRDLLFADIFDTFTPPDIKAGESSTFILYFVVKGEPRSGRLVYTDPYTEI